MLLTSLKQIKKSCFKQNSRPFKKLSPRQFHFLAKSDLKHMRRFNVNFFKFCINYRAGECQLQRNFTRLNSVGRSYSDFFTGRSYREVLLGCSYRDSVTGSIYNYVFTDRISFHGLLLEEIRYIFNNLNKFLTLV